MVGQQGKLASQPSQQPGDQPRVPRVAEAQPPVRKAPDNGETLEPGRHQRFPFLDQFAGHLNVDVRGVGLNSHDVEAGIDKNVSVRLDRAVDDLIVSL